MIEVLIYKIEIMYSAVLLPPKNGQNTDCPSIVLVATEASDLTKL